ncbi:hypothetical protein [Streptomyces sp. NPDC086787]|uniref:hypothetical protein n=1 Tax=Streptomyces sp. NPDC086787 TaxID=3365759 RepID=UPI003815B422
MASLPLSGPDAQLLAVVVAIRAARGGTGNITGMELAGLRLGNPSEAVAALRGLGWQLDDGVFNSDPAAPPVPVTVPDLSRETDHPLPLGKQTRSRVSGWTTRVLCAKPLKKLPPAARLAGLFLAAHSTPQLLGQIPPTLPPACRAALPNLLDNSFLTELSAGQCRLDPQVRHLAGMRPPTIEENAIEEKVMKPSEARARGFQFSTDAWEQWKTSATPALRRHMETVESCPVCAMPAERVAEAFMLSPRPARFSKDAKAAYGQWKNAHPDRGPVAAKFTVDFRAEHGHGPSFKQLGEGLGLQSAGRPLLSFIVERLLANRWLTRTGTVPWTLRPGEAAHAQGITLPRARKPQAPATPARP